MQKTRMDTRLASWITVLAFGLLQSIGMLWAVESGSLSGTLRDATNGVIASAKVTLTNTALKSQFTATSNAQDFIPFRRCRWAATIS